MVGGLGLCRPELPSAVASAAERGARIDKEVVLDLAAQLLEMSDRLESEGRRAEALVAEGLESCLVAALLEPEQASGRSGA